MISFRTGVDSNATAIMSSAVITVSVVVGTTSSSTQAKYFNNKVFSDVMLFIGKDGVEFFGHKAIIAAKSDFFEILFLGDWKDKDEVKLEEVNVAAFREILWYMYTDEINIESKILLDVLELSHRYNVVGMLSALSSEETFSTYMETQVWKYLTFAMTVSDFGLIIRCVELIDKKAPELLLLDDFLDVQPKVIDVFIGRNTLEIEEVKLFQLIVKWAYEQEKKTGTKAVQIMNPFLARIRFTQMSLQELTRQVEPTNILSKSTLRLIKNAISSRTKIECGFDSQPRMNTVSVDFFKKAMSSKCSQLSKLGKRIMTKRCYALHGTGSEYYSSQPTEQFICAPCAMTCHRDCKISSQSTVMDFVSNSACSCSLTYNACHKSTYR